MFTKTIPMSIIKLENNLNYCEKDNNHNKICRTCLQQTKEYHSFSLDFVESNIALASVRNKLLDCCPEIDLSSVQNSFLCNNCCEALSFLYNFRARCIESEQQINNYLSNSAHSTQIIELTQLHILDTVVKIENVDLSVKVKEEYLGDNRIKQEHIYLDEYREENVEFGLNNDRSDETVQDNSFECYTCGYKTDLKCNLELHLQTFDHGDFVQSTQVQNDNENCTQKCSFDITGSRFNSMFTSIINTNGKTFKCMVCSYTTDQKLELQQHLMLHMITTFKCRKCAYSTHIKADLCKHMKMLHTTMKKCIMCDYTTDSAVNLKRHMLIHGETQYFKCSVCDYVSEFLWRIKAHLRNHTEMRPFKCSQCKYTTKCKSWLNRHMIKHSSKENIKKCLLCNYSTKRVSQLKTHLLEHY